MAGKKKILIVDADQESSEATRVVLKEEGFQVERAFSSAQGYTTMEFFQPDLILLEVMLEEHDSGIRLAQRIRRHPVFGNMRIFVYTAVGERTGASFSIEEDGYWIKADDYAEKPLAAEELAGRIRALIGS